MLPCLPRFHPRMLAVILASFLLAVPCLAQQRALTATDYARAEKFMNYNTNPLVLRAGVRPTWLPDERFWYRIATENGNEFVLIDPARGTRAPAFDHAKLAAALSAAAGTKYEAFKLPFQQIEFSADGKAISFGVGQRRWTCDVQGNQCNAATDGGGNRGGRGGQRGGGAGGAATTVASPDGKLAAFIRDYNLWVRDITTGKETQLTTDGVKDFGYATNNAGWTKSDSPVVVWSPDSKKIATFQHDGRGVGEMYLADTRVGHPNLQAWKYPLPGDDKIFMIERVIIDVEAARVVRLKMPPDPHRSTLCDHVVCGGVWADVQWSQNSAQLAFVSTSRDHKDEQLRVADAATGAVRDVLEEKVATFYESGNGRVNWRFLPDSNEVIWFSERDNWGQLYLYDLQTGKLKNQITTGEGNVTQLLRVDEKNRMLYFLGVGKEKGRDPYFRHLYRIGFDGKNRTLLSPEDGDHDIALSPSGRFFTDSYSKPDMPPVAVLRDLDGKQILTLEKADIDREIIAKIRDEGLKRSQVEETFTHFTEDIGPRLTGTPAHKQAAEWARDRLKEWGLNNPRLEAWEFGRGWALDKLTVEMIEPRYMPLIGYPDAWSPSMTSEITAAPLFLGDKTLEAIEQLRGKLKGAIVLSQPIQTSFERADRLQPTLFDVPVAIGQPRRTGVTPPLANQQNVGRIVREAGAGVLLKPNMGEHGTLFVLGRDAREGETPVPSIVLSSEHYNMIARMIQRGQPVKLRVNVQTRFLSDDKNSYNVIADLPGTDPALRDEIVMIGGHLDSWHSATGATDNADGAAVVMEAMRILKTIGARPKRTIRMALWSGEEEGLLGSKKYVERYLMGEANKTAREKFSVYFNMDPGTGPIYGWYLENNEAVKPIFDAWLEPFRDLSARRNIIQGIGNTDHLSFIAAGVPGFNPVQDYVNYDVRTHHTNMDTFERVKVADLQQCAIVMASFAYHAAVRQEKIPFNKK